MRLGRTLLLVAAVLSAAGNSTVLAEQGGQKGTQKGPDSGVGKAGETCTARRSCGVCRRHCGRTCEEPCFETKTKTVTRTIWETKCEKRTKTVYDIVYDYKTVDDVKKISETHYRTEEFTYQRPVYETRTKAVPYTVSWPVYETRSREVGYTAYVPARETRKKSVPHTTYKTVTEHSYRTISYQVPRKVYYKTTIQVDNGCWETRITRCRADSGAGSGTDNTKAENSKAGSSQKDGNCNRCCKRGCSRSCGCSPTPRVSYERVWVPKLEEKEITRCRTVYDVRTKKVPYVRTRLVPETTTREVPYTITRMVPVTKTRTVNYQVSRTMTEQRTKNVNYVVKRMITEKGTRTVPYTKVREVPTTRTIKVPRKVPRTVHYTITRKVPRKVTCEVEIRVPCGCSGSADGNKDAESSDDTGEIPTPAEPAEVTTADASVAPKYRLASTEKSLRSGADAGAHFVTGMDLYRSGKFNAAANEFEVALNATPNNAKYAYFRALALQQSGQTNEAYAALAVAVELEKLSPVENWGRVMQRVQGSIRLWLEDGRKQLSREA